MENQGTYQISEEVAQLYASVQPKAIILGKIKTKHASHAEEILHESMVRVMGAMHQNKVPGHCTLEQYFWGIWKNTIHEIIYRDKYAKRKVGDIEELSLLEPAVDDGDFPDEGDEGLVGKLKKFMEFSETEKKEGLDILVKGRLVERLSYRELIKHVGGITEKNARNKVYRWIRQKYKLVLEHTSLYEIVVEAYGTWELKVLFAENRQHFPEISAYLLKKMDRVQRGRFKSKMDNDPELKKFVDYLDDKTEFRNKFHNQWPGLAKGFRAILQFDHNSNPQDPSSVHSSPRIEIPKDLRFEMQEALMVFAYLGGKKSINQ